ncbi:MAG: zinc-ribbon domain-containing protein [Ktedonobacteraceae bacterium]
MAQINSPVCPQCGVPVAPGQRFCPNCGATTDAGFGAPTAMASSGEQYPLGSDVGSAVPPPPPESQYMQSAQQFTYYPQQASAPQSFTPAPQGYVAPQQAAPSYTQPQKDATKSVLGQIGCGLLVIILLIVGACGGLGYLGYRWVADQASSTSTDTTTSNSNTTTNGGGGGSTPTVPSSSKNINQQVTYASAEITIVSVQEGASGSFSGDSNTSAPVTVRLNIKEHNPISSTIYLNYDNTLRLILPDKTSVAPIDQQQSGVLSQAVTQNDWIDFPLTSNIAIDQLTLQIGGQDEAQMTLPLTGKADLSAYTLKTITPNTAFTYAGMNWTLTTVTSSLSAGGKQAGNGKRYIVVTLKLSNPTSDTFYFTANNIVRLQGGGVTNAPTDSTVPSVNSAGATDQSGTVTFLMPQNTNSFTLIMLAQTNVTPPVSQYTTSFQI